MDQLSRDELNRIIALGSDSLTQVDKEFLKARREYLTKEQREDFKETLKELPVGKERP